MVLVFSVSHRHPHLLLFHLKLVVQILRFLPHLQADPFLCPLPLRLNLLIYLTRDLALQPNLLNFLTHDLVLQLVLVPRMA